MTDLEIESLFLLEILSDPWRMTSRVVAMLNMSLSDIAQSALNERSEISTARSRPHSSAADAVRVSPIHFALDKDGSSLLRLPFQTSPERPARAA
ncbi:hypothetical protein EVAR_18514_1 [Eumeta japonica]|uniref:Uncharacterized protein n=1 Tax=Eumeta variegata TaxID=151549 RepID=A0A4C1UZT2_EUMVA|nr:hypothetical protein EVAR_18514_1 [Eumeta japonica]